MVWRHGNPVRFGVEVIEASDLAGGPIALDLVLGIDGASRFAMVSGDRKEVAIRATFAGDPLDDPDPGYFYSGPCGVAELTPARPFRRRVEVGDHVRLEDALDRLEPGARGTLLVSCACPVPQARTKEEAWAAPRGDAQMLEATLSFELRRDDAQLAALVDRLIRDVRHGPAEAREWPLRMLLSMRAKAAVERWERLVDHPSKQVSDRVRQTLSYRSVVRAKP
jgi:hypothetical protein